MSELRNSNNKKIKIVWVIMTNHSSCMVNAVCSNYKYALNWIEKENKKYGFEMYFIERSQLLYNKEGRNE